MDLIEVLLILGTVVGFVDANTIRVQDDTGKPITVKLACINTGSANSQQNLVAAQRLKQLLPIGSPVVVKNDTEEFKEGRTIGEVFVDNRSINLKMVEEGNAIVERKTLQVCRESAMEFFIAEANAKNQRLGLWQKSNNNAVNSKIHSLRGKLIYEEIPPVMSSRAYLGEEFFLITNGSKKPLVLRPSPQVSHAKLQSLHNQEVEIKARYVEGTRPSPQGDSACPLDVDGQCLAQGQGYQVLSITQRKS